MIWDGGNKDLEYLYGLTIPKKKERLPCPAPFIPYEAALF